MLDASPGGRRAISGFRWVRTGQPAILRQCHNPLEKVLDAACFPLVPYVNRIRGGRFNFRGRDGAAGAEHGRRSKPAARPRLAEPVERRSATRPSRRAALHHEPGEWPWRYEARQEFALDEGADRHARAAATCRTEPMPCGLGLHPYFPCGPADPARHRGRRSPGRSTTRCCRSTKVPAEGRFDLRDRLVCGQDLDNGFGGWGGEARMSDPDWPFELRLSSPDARFFQLYSPPDGGIFVAEPVTHANAALNAPEERMARSSACGSSSRARR